jgi:ferredoxin
MVGRDIMMTELRSHVAEKLDDLDGVLALRRTEGGTAPYLFQKGDDLSTLVLEPRYAMGKIISALQKHYPDADFGIVARACDIRALIEMAKREQVDPDRLYLLGIACTAEQAEECHCAAPAPDLAPWPRGRVLGIPVEGAPPNPVVTKYKEMSLEKRRAFWQEQFAKCIKCYGCRDICPECFCESCALEDPLWVEPGELAPPFPMFHLIKAMHMSGRCVACRQCELTCPAHIPLTVLYDLIRQDVGTLLGYEPGGDMEMPPPLSVTFDKVPLRMEVE